MSFPCGICTETRPPARLVHIQDDGQPIHPNPVHPDTHYCAPCLQRLFDEHESPCPYCRQRFLRPADEPGVQCAYKMTRKSKKLPNGYTCEVKQTRLNEEDNAYYCDEHYDLGPAEMQLRLLREQNARGESNANKRKKLAEEQMKEKLRRQQVNTLHKASILYQRALDDAMDCTGSAPSTPAAQ